MSLREYLNLVLLCSAGIAFAALLLQSRLSPSVARRLAQASAAVFAVALALQMLRSTPGYQLGATALVIVGVALMHFATKQKSRFECWLLLLFAALCLWFSGAIVGDRDGWNRAAVHYGQGV